MKKYFKDVFRTTSVLFISVLLTIGLVAFALTYPSTPSGQTTGGKFSEYFDKIFTGTCPTGKAIAGYDTNKDPICVTTGTGSSGGIGGIEIITPSPNKVCNMNSWEFIKDSTGNNLTKENAFCALNGVDDDSTLALGLDWESYISYDASGNWIYKNASGCGDSNFQVRCVKFNGGTGGGSGWQNVPLTDTSDFDNTCYYRFTVNTETSTGLPPEDISNRWHYPTSIGTKSLILISHSSVTSHINSSTKNIYRVNGSLHMYVTKLEKRCGGLSQSFGRSHNNDCRIVENSIRTAGPCGYTFSTSCNSDEYVVNGGIKSASNMALQDNFPVDSNTWYTTLLAAGNCGTFNSNPSSINNTSKAWITCCK